MARAAHPPGTGDRRAWMPWQGRRARVLAWALGLLALCALVILAFPWDWLRGPLNRAVSERTGRHFEITQRLDVRLGRTMTVIADGLVFANPDWAHEPYLVQAERAEMALRLWPLLRHRRLEIVELSLQAPRLGLEALADGRRTWSLDRQGDAGGAMVVDTLRVDRGRLRYIAPHQGADIAADFAIEPAAGGADATQPALPLVFGAQGRWRGQAFQAQGRSASVLALRQARGEPFPLDVRLASGAQRVHAVGTLRAFNSLQGADLRLALRGPDLAQWHALIGVVLPATPPYVLQGRLRHEGRTWHFDELAGEFGRTDLAGALALETGGAVPRLSGALRSRRLDAGDLSPLAGVRAAPGRRASAARADGRLLPDTPIDLARLGRMEADVRYEAARVQGLRSLPLDRLAMHVRLAGGVLRLDPMELGVAGGRVTGRLQLKAGDSPRAGGELALALQASQLQLQRLFPASDLNRASVGRLHGRLDLSGRGKTLGQMLGSGQGELSLLLGQGRISNLLLEIAGLDGGEIIKFMMGRDQRIELRCGAAAFEIRQGLMQSRLLVLDTADTVVYGEGAINLRNEAMELVFHPYPKDKSILALRSPLKLGGTLARPEAGVDKGAVAARAGLAIALALINPLLGLAATVETGPGQDADCAAVLRDAAQPRQAPASTPR